MKDRTREQLAAATGLVTAVLFGISFVIGLSPEPPDLNAPTAAIAGFVVANQDALRVEVLLNTVAMLSFLWFLGSVRAGLRTAEGGAGRVSAIASGAETIAPSTSPADQGNTGMSSCATSATAPMVTRTSGTESWKMGQH